MCELLSPLVVMADENGHPELPVIPQVPLVVQPPVIEPPQIPLYSFETLLKSQIFTLVKFCLSFMKHFVFAQSQITILTIVVIANKLKIFIFRSNNFLTDVSYQKNSTNAHVRIRIEKEKKD